MKFKYPALLALFMVPITQASDLVITGIYDGPLSGGTPKGVELYVLNDIADLSVCGVGFANNGGGSDGQEFTFPTVAATAGSYIYVAMETAQFNAFFGFDPTYTTGYAAINGDDAVELFCNNVVIDTFGDIDQDGTGTAWDSLDGWAYRVAGSGPDGTSFVIGNWTFSGVDGLEGGTTYDTTTSPFPLKTYADETSGGGDTGGGDTGGGDTGGDTSGTTISGSVCTNCPDLEKYKDLADFNASDYYSAVQTEIDLGSSVDVIKTVINSTITNDIKSLSYTEVWTALTYTDEDPANTDNVILWYTARSQAKSTNGSGAASSNPDNWNREHSWPKSHGFPDEGQAAYSDIHHLRPSDISVNSSRDNLDFDNSDSALEESPLNRIDSDSFEPRDDIKGDVARMMFYMDTRYEGAGSDNVPDLVLVNRLTSSSEPNLGFLCTLIAWNNADAVDASEQRRNDRIYEVQGNRNPFIDNPAWVASLYPADSCDTSGGDTGGGDTGGGDTGGDTTINLFISEYVEGSSNNKAIEIYNNSAQSVDLSAANVVLVRSTNGGTSTSDIALTGTVAAHSTFVIAHTSANAEIQALANQLSGNVNHNGDDAYTLLVDGVIVDSFGQVGTDPGTNWGSDEFSTLNNTLRRNPNVQTGDTVVDDAFDPSVEWTGYGVDVADGLGQHSVDLGEIYISEYIEGSGNNKALEFYNPNSTSVDLSTYTLLRSTNGGSSEATITLEGSIAPFGVFVIANSSSADAIKDVADQLTSAINHNGDDAYILYNNGVIVDSFGQVGTDPGSFWGSGEVTTANHTLVRKASVKQGDVIVDDAFDPALEWDAFAVDTFEYLGRHGANGGGTGGEIVELGQCADPATLISGIQGSGLVSPVVGETHVVEAIVNAAFPNLTGFFIQEEAVDMDNDSQTSEGLFVYYSGSLPAVGSVVRVVGKVEEYYEKTQVNATTAPLVCRTDTVVPTSFSLPFADALVPESLEGMLVTASSELVVTDNYSLGKYGEVALANQRLFVPTNLFVAGSAEAIALAAQNALSKITLDDGMNGTNPDPVIYPTGYLSAANTLRGGDTVSSLTGIMDYGFNLYRVIPTESPTFVASNPRTAAPDLTLGNLTVASLNVLNLFNGNGLGGGFPTARGATNAVELERQMTKTVAALAAMDADIVGLMEIENDGFGANSAIAQLTDRLNAEVGVNTYTFVNGGGVIGTDEIKVALLYKPGKVATVGSYKILNSSNSISDGQGPLFVDTKNRPAFNQKFALVENGQEIVVSVNHLKSKGSTCGAGDDDTSTGQGSCNVTRTRAAQALTTFLAQEYADTPTLIIGDLNSYAQEDPILKIKQAGYTDLANLFQGAEAYSYAYGGEYGYLDHALANASLLDKVVGTVEWHINADEPIVLDYNFEDKSAQQQTDYYAPDAYRMSDHDPVVIAIDLKAAVVKGDWDGDGDVDSLDISAFTKAILGKQTIDMSFDLNNDGVINILDARALRSLCTHTSCATN